MIGIYYQIHSGLTDEMIWPDYPVEKLVGLNLSLQAGLALEPEDGGGPITRYIGYKLLGKPRATRDEALAMLPIRPGDPSPFFDPVDDISKEPGATVVRDFSSPTGIAVAGPSQRPDWCTPARLLLLSAIPDGRAYWIKPENSLPVFFKVTGLLDTPVPESFPDRINSEGNPHTWSTWGSFEESHHPIQKGDEWYRSSAYGAAGTNLEIAQWIPFFMVGGQVLTQPEYMALD